MRLSARAACVVGVAGGALMLSGTTALDEARTLVFMGDAHACAATLDDALAHDEGLASRADAWLLLGQCRFLRRHADRAGFALRAALARDPRLTLAPDASFDPWLEPFFAAQRKIVAGDVCGAAVDLRVVAESLAAAGDGQLAAVIFAEARDLDPTLRPVDAAWSAAFSFERGSTPFSAETVCERGRAVARAAATREPTILVVDANVSDADVEVDGVRVGRVGERLAVEPGRSEVVIVRPGYEPQALSVVPRSGQTVRARVEMVPVRAAAE